MRRMVSECRRCFALLFDKDTSSNLCLFEFPTGLMVLVVKTQEGHWEAFLSLMSWWTTLLCLAPFTSKISAKISRWGSNRCLFTSTIEIEGVVSSAQPSSRRSNVPSLPRVSNNSSVEGSNGSSNPSTGNRPPSAGDALRRISYTRKLNRSNSEKLNGNGTANTGGHHSSSVGESTFV